MSSSSCKNAIVLQDGQNAKCAPALSSLLVTTEFHFADWTMTNTFQLLLWCPNFFFGAFAITLVLSQTAETIYVLHAAGFSDGCPNESNMFLNSFNNMTEYVSESMEHRVIMDF